MKTCENVDSAKIKGAFYTTDIDILRVASMNRYTPTLYHRNLKKKPVTETFSFF